MVEGGLEAIFLVIGETAAQGFQQRAAVGLVHEVHALGPTQAGFQAEGAVGMGDAVVFGAGNDGHHGFEAFRLAGGDGPLGVTEIAGAPGGKAAVEPGLLRDPIYGGLTVGGLVDVGVEFALGVKTAARALDDDVVATFGEALGGHFAEGIAAEKSRFPATAVGGADEDGRVVARGLGEVMVGVEAGAIGHGHGDGALDGDVMVGWGQLEQASNEQAAEMVDGPSQKGQEKEQGAPLHRERSDGLGEGRVVDDFLEDVDDVLVEILAGSTGALAELQEEGWLEAEEDAFAARLLRQGGCRQP